mgnify:CR=1 FL=1
MHDAPRFTLNRSLIILRHKPPFLDWLTSIDPDPSVTLANIEDDSDVFLIPDEQLIDSCLLYTSPSPRDGLLSRMPSSA